MEFAHERTVDLMRAYDDYISSCKYIFMPDVYKAIVDSPAPRFYVSESRASIVVLAMIAGRDRFYRNMRKPKLEMFQEIYRRVTVMRNDNPELSVIYCCREVVRQPAPKFYISPNTAKAIICKHKEEWRKRKLRKFQHWRRLL